MRKKHRRKSHRYRPSAGRIIARILLWLFLLPVILVLLAAGGAFAYLNLFDFPYDAGDDVSTLIAEPPMPTKERLLSFNAEQETFTMAFDKSDIWWVIKEAELDNHVLWMARDALEKFDFQLDQYGFELRDSRLYLSARLVFHQFLRVPVRAELTVEVTKEGQLALRVRDVMVGNRLHVPLNRLGISDAETVKPLYTLDLMVHPRMEHLLGAQLAADQLILTFQVQGSDLFQQVQASEPEAKLTAQLLTEPVAQIVYENLYNNESLAYAAMLQSIEHEPKKLISFKVEELALAGREEQNAYFSGRYTPFRERFMPELNAEAAYAKREEFEQTAGKRADALLALAKALHNSYKNGLLSVGNASLLVKKKPMSLSSLPGLDWTAYDGWLDEMKARVVYLDTYNLYAYDDEKADTDGMPKLLNMPLDSKMNLSGFKKGLPCPVGLIVALPSGEHELLMVKTGDVPIRLPITSEAYIGLMDAENTPHWLPEELAARAAAEEMAGDEEAEEIQA
ncbi:MAG: hypothetical protein RRZ24_01565 [Clostridia bacterium]